MARTVVPLSDSKCDAAKPKAKSYTLFDGGGLYLEVMPSGSKKWRMKYIRPSGKPGLATFGDYPAVSLKQARQKREDAKTLLAQELDPNDQKREAAIQRKQSEQSSFEAVALDWHASMTKRWSPDYAAVFLRRMENHLFPVIGPRPVSSLKTRDLMLPLKSLEKQEAPVIAERMKQAISSVMRYAVQHGLIDHNPAHDLKGIVTPQAVKHRPALPLERLPELLQRVDNYSGRALTRLAVELSLLSFVRSSELRFARWNEIDHKKALWTIPGKREAIEGVKYSERGAKMKTPHLVPLSRQALAVLEKIKAISGNSELIFPGDSSSGAPLSERTINQALQRMGYDTKTDVCGHGFRTMACGSLVQSTLWQKDAVERQMSHQERNDVRLAYTHQAEFMKERRLMMQWWADYLDANRQEHVSPYDFAHPEEVANVVKLAKKA
ncbi:MAG: integrase arm-type DNA-binding domain-containing protein [bacterium]|nr:integrase arm-type DNA-binding domain-containing protein [bacterium]